MINDKSMMIHDLVMIDYLWIMMDDLLFIHEVNDGCYHWYCPVAFVLTLTLGQTFDRIHQKRGSSWEDMHEH